MIIRSYCVFSHFVIKQRLYYYYYAALYKCPLIKLTQHIYIAPKEEGLPMMATTGQEGSPSFRPVSGTLGSIG